MPSGRQEPDRDLSLQHHAVPILPEFLTVAQKPGFSRDPSAHKHQKWRLSLVQAGRYLLGIIPEAVVKVTVIGLQRQEVGLYQCEIYLSPDNAAVLYHWIQPR